MTHRTDMTNVRNTDSSDSARSFAFTLIVEANEKTTEEVSDSVYAAGCDNALVHSRGGVIFIDFDCDGSSLTKEVLKAIQAVETAVHGLQVLRIEPEDQVTASEIARRSKRTRESVRKLISGERGPGGFPHPIAAFTRKSPLWSWLEVASWFGSIGYAEENNIESDAQFISVLNGLLTLRHNNSGLQRIREMASEIGLSDPILNRLIGTGTNSPHQQRRIAFRQPPSAWMLPREVA